MKIRAPYLIRSGNKSRFPEIIEAVAMQAAPGMSPRGIAEELTGRGIPTKEGPPRWDHSTVKRILLRTA